MGQLIDLTGRTFWRLTVVERYGTHYSQGSERKFPLWLCRCDCGNTAVVMGQNLRAGNTRSCDCMRVDCCKENGAKRKAARA